MEQPERNGRRRDKMTAIKDPLLVCRKPSTGSKLTETKNIGGCYEQTYRLSWPCRVASAFLWRFWWLNRKAHKRWCYEQAETQKPENRPSQPFLRRLRGLGA